MKPLWIGVLVLGVCECRGESPHSDAVNRKLKLTRAQLAVGDPISNSIGMLLVPIPAGAFMMTPFQTIPPEFARRLNENQARFPRNVPASVRKRILRLRKQNSLHDLLKKSLQNHVKFKQPFFLSVYEVTQEQYEGVTGKNPSVFATAAKPVDSVTWYDAVEFCNRLSDKEKHRRCYEITSIERDAQGSIEQAQVRNVLSANGYRLPTEAEWEYACRTGVSTVSRITSRSRRLQDYAWFLANSEESTHPVGLKKPNRWGLFDMHGNVWEWCQDWHSTRSLGTVTDPTGPASGANRVGRGGGWSSDVTDYRPAARIPYMPSHRDDRVGFRVLRRFAK